MAASTLCGGGCLLCVIGSFVFLFSLKTSSGCSSNDSSDDNCTSKAMKLLALGFVLIAVACSLHGIAMCVRQGEICTLSEEEYQRRDRSCE